MSLLLTVLVIGGLSIVGALVGVCLVLMVADKSRQKREDYEKRKK